MDTIRTETVEVMRSAIAEILAARDKHFNDCNEAIVTLERLYPELRQLEEPKSVPEIKRVRLIGQPVDPARQKKRGPKAKPRGDTAECSKCHVVKPLSAFAQRGGRPMTMCAACRSQALSAGHQKREAATPATRTAKPCRKCGEVKPLADFPNHKECADGHTGTCRDCTYARAHATEQRLAAAPNPGPQLDGKFRCDECRCNFMSKKALDEHVDQRHSGKDVEEL